jgi:hydrogenase maturation protease
VILDGRQTVATADVWRCSTHTIGIAQALELAQVLGRLPARLILYGVEGRQFEIGGRPSPEVEEACWQLAYRIVQLARV